MQVKQLLKKGTDFLGNRRNALLDCELLLSFTFGFNREKLMINADKDVEVELESLFEQYLQRVSEGEPLAYILGEKEFYGLNFFVDKRVLIPRPETELIVEKALECMEGSRDLRILDLGTGSCNISVAIATDLGDRLLQIDAVDISEDACEVAKINVEQHGLSEYIHVFQSDLLENIDSKHRYDLIVANLPYIGESKHRFISADTEKYEPKEALFGGHDGLVLYNKLFQQIVEKGLCFNYLIGEFGFAQGYAARELLNKYFDQNWGIEVDLAGIERIFIVKNAR
ncbi:MAG: peptide chain release factor N(5)-glutamine methyltransferase [bacterium]|nr:peptide chain release factor N(5)-glutamine methyltransferase [bacterium]